MAALGSGDDETGGDRQVKVFSGGLNIIVRRNYSGGKINHSDQQRMV